MQLRSAPRSRALSAVSAPVLALAAAAALVPAAHANFVVARCGGSAISGTGATFAGPAQDAFSSSFRTTSAGCPGHPLIDYTRTGSGAGRNAMGAANGVRDPALRFGGTDEGPSSTAMGLMNAGPNAASTNDDGKIRVIPIASGAVAPTVNYPNDPGSPATPCPIPSEFQLVRGGQTRLAVTNAMLERAWAGLSPTWGDFLPGLQALDADCAAKPLVRVVRQDSSGTTFAWKDFLSRVQAGVANTSSTNWKPGLTSSSLLNRQWPNTRLGNADGLVAPPGDPNGLGFQTSTVGAECNATYIAGGAPFSTSNLPVCRSGTEGNVNSAGNGPQARVLKATDGSIAYTELATVLEENLRVSATNLDKYAMPLALRGADVPNPVGNPQGNAALYIEPSAIASGMIDGGTTGGANCQNVQALNVPPTSDPTASTGWNNVTMVFPETGYGACSLTYMLAFDDNAPVYTTIADASFDSEEGKARALKDYLDYIVSDAGQATLISNNYAPLTGSAVLAARDGVGRIEWDKTGSLRPPPRTLTPPPPPPPVAPPPPPPPGGPGGPGATPPSNAFTIASARAKGRELVLSIKVPGAGSLRATASGTYKLARKTRKVAVGTTRSTVTKAATVTLRIKLSTASRSALRRAKRLVVVIKVTYTPTGGTAASKSRTLTLKAPKKKS